MVCLPAASVPKVLLYMGRHPPGVNPATPLLTNPRGGSLSTFKTSHLLPTPHPGGWSLWPLGQKKGILVKKIKKNCVFGAGWTLLAISGQPPPGSGLWSQKPVSQNQSNTTAREVGSDTPRAMIWTRCKAWSMVERGASKLTQNWRFW